MSHFWAGAGRWPGLLIWLLCWSLVAPAVAAGPDSPQSTAMRFVVVRGSDASCEPTCPEWISAEGNINANSPQLLKKTLQLVGSRKLPIVVFSAGGDSDAAMTLGRLIRRSALGVAVGRTLFDGCRPEQSDCKANDGKGARFLGRAISAGGYCASECVLMLAGGVRRLVATDAIVGVRQTAPSRKLSTYVKEMGVDSSLLDAMEKAPATGLDPLLSERMLKMKLITDAAGPELLTAGSVCKAAPAADNCRVFTVLDLKR
ncbi:hypothetical protein [Mesorhizobium sp.]|uniref:COG3904 family protein n=1 Tax=Mesorhizobium sp. TaxID=1871066 RepID=UPI003BABB35B